jgi:hypothetical protein
MVHPLAKMTAATSREYEGVISMVRLHNSILYSQQTSPFVTSRHPFKVL